MTQHIVCISYRDDSVFQDKINRRDCVFNLPFFFRTIEVNVEILIIVRLKYSIVIKDVIYVNTPVL